MEQLEAVFGNEVVFDPVAQPWKLTYFFQWLTDTFFVYMDRHYANMDQRYIPWLAQRVEVGRRVVSGGWGSGGGVRRCGCMGGWCRCQAVRGTARHTGASWGRWRSLSTCPPTTTSTTPPQV